MADAVLGIDLGTTEVKIGLFTLDGEQIALTRRPYPTISDEPGAAEQDPRDWWSAIVDGVRALGPERARAAAICAVGQGPTLVAVDGAGEPVRRAITWLDRRPGRDAAAVVRASAAGRAASVRAAAAVHAAGNEAADGSRDAGAAAAAPAGAVAEVGARGETAATAGFGLAPAIDWLGRHDPGRLARATWLLTAWDWVGLRLSGVAATSLQRDEAESHLPGDGSRVAPFVQVGKAIGRLPAAVAEQLGLGPGIVVIAGVNDGTATILGAGLRRAGEAVDTGGASGGFAVYSDRPVALPGTFCAPAPLQGLWVVGGAMAATGASLEWLADSVLGGQWTIEALIDQAADIPAGAAGLVFLPYLAGERSPIWDDRASGAFVGLRLDHVRGHLVRAVLEASAFAVRHVAAPIVEAGIEVADLRLAGRPATSRTWAQIKSDVNDVPVLIPRAPEASVLGAAMLAAVGAGLVPSLSDAVERMAPTATRLEPRPETRTTYDRAYDVYRRLYPSLREAMHELAGERPGDDERAGRRDIGDHRDVNRGG